MFYLGFSAVYFLYRYTVKKARFLDIPLKTACRYIVINPKPNQSWIYSGKNGEQFCYTVSFLGVCTNNTAPSVSSINRILRNRAAERAAAEYAQATQVNQLINYIINRSNEKSIHEKSINQFNERSINGIIHHVFQ